MAVIVIQILVLIVVAVLLVRVCKHRAIGSSSSFSDKITSVNGSMTALQSPYGAQVAGKETTLADVSQGPGSFSVWRFCFFDHLPKGNMTQMIYHFKALI